MHYCTNARSITIELRYQKRDGMPQLSPGFVMPIVHFSADASFFITEFRKVLVQDFVDLHQVDS